MASMALMPVWSGSFTGWRSMTPGRLHLQAPAELGDDRALAVDGLAEGVDHPAEQGVADRHRQDPAGRPDDLALLERVDLAEHHRADGVLVQVEGQAD